MTGAHLLFHIPVPKIAYTNLKTCGVLYRALAQETAGETAGMRSLTSLLLQNAN